MNLSSFNVTATTEIYTLSLHDALPISGSRRSVKKCRRSKPPVPHRSPRQVCYVRAIDIWVRLPKRKSRLQGWRSEEHTSELQSHSDLVCRLLLEKKNKLFYEKTDHRWN